MATKTTFVPTSIQHLYRREPAGIYYGVFYTGGKQKWVSLKTKIFDVGRAALLEHLKVHYAMARAQKTVTEGRATMDALANLYLQNVELDASIKKSTREYRAKTIRYLFRSWPGLASKNPAQISELVCLHWAADYREKFSATLYNNTVDSLRGIFALALNHGLIARNPAAAIQKVRVTPKRLELPSSAQFRQIVDIIRNAGAACSAGCGDLVEFLAYSGLRANEAANVKWNDIDLERGRLYVAPGKNSKARHVPIFAAMADLIRRMKDDPRWFKNEHRRKAGFVLSVCEADKALTSACAQVGVKRMVRHDLRHLFATRAIESGVDIVTVSRWLGHSDGGVLAMKVYGHLRDEHSQAMATKVTF
jgi:integrase